MKYLLVHLPEAEKGDPAQVIIESTSPLLPAPTSEKGKNGCLLLSI